MQAMKQCMNINTKLLIIFTLLFSGFLSHAEPPRWYQYELIIFKYTSNTYTESESWPDKPGLPDYQNSHALLTGKADDNPASTKDFVLLKQNQLILKKEARAITLSSRRKLLLHTGWIQTMHPKDQTLPVSFKIGKEYTILVPEPTTLPLSPDRNQLPVPTDTTTDTTGADQDDPGSAMIPLNVSELEGTISISIGRYLHVWSDFLFRRPDDNPTTINDTPGTVRLKEFRYKDHRRMRSRELHYIDSPSFGILIYALPYKQVVENK